MSGAPRVAHLRVGNLADKLEQRAALHLQPRYQFAVHDKLNPLVLDAHNVAVHVEVDQPDATVGQWARVRTRAALLAEPWGRTHVPRTRTDRPTAAGPSACSSWMCMIVPCTSEVSVIPRRCTAVISPGWRRNSTVAAASRFRFRAWAITSQCASSSKCDINTCSSSSDPPPPAAMALLGALCL